MKRNLIVLPVVAAAIALVPASCSSVPTDAPTAVVAAAGKAIEQIPPPKRATEPFRVDPPMVTFGIVAVRTSHAKTVVVTNVMDRAITVIAVEVSGEYFAVVEASPLPDTIPPGGTLRATVRFEPGAGCWCRGTLTIWMKGPPEQQRVEMSGRAEGGVPQR